MTTQQIIDAIAQERKRQEEKHGEFSVAGPFKSDAERLVILVEEVGEVARALQDGDAESENLRAEIVQCAAVCVAWLESL
jgi:NTP pyrophosphatase (non-canonical NTP hydrolase)